MSEEGPREQGRPFNVPALDLEEEGAAEDDLEPHVPRLDRHRGASRPPRTLNPAGRNINVDFQFSPDAAERATPVDKRF